MAPRALWLSLSDLSRDRVKTLSLYIGCFAAFLAVLNLLPVVWRSAGMPAFATEFVVDQKLEAKIAPLAKAVTDISREFETLSSESAEMRRSQVDEAIFKWTTELARANDNAPLQQMIQSRLRDLQQEREGIMRRIEQLQRARYGPR